MLSRLPKSYNAVHTQVARTISSQQSLQTFGRTNQPNGNNLPEKPIGFNWRDLFLIPLLLILGFIGARINSVWHQSSTKAIRTENPIEAKRDDNTTPSDN